MKIPELAKILNPLGKADPKDIVQAAQAAAQGLSGKDLEVNVTMMGGRRCGKTSVLAAMQDCFQQTIYQSTNLRFYSEDEATLKLLREKKAEMDAYFVDRRGRSFQPDDTPTLEIMRYSFYVGLRGKKGEGRIRISFLDYPGEWLINNPDQLNRLVEDSRILLIAVDTPYLVEEGGKYNRLRNCCDDVSNAIIRSDFADNGPGMILFVPLKCEKYRKQINRHSPDLRAVRSAVEQSYGNLIEYATKSNDCFTAVMPIFTFGDAVFSDFVRDDGGEIILENGTPQHANYIFTDEAGNCPRPEYCEQPLFYVLAYTLAMAQRVRAHKQNMWSGMLSLFQEKVLNWPSARDYLNEFGAICEKIRDPLNANMGYDILTGCDWLNL